MDNALRLLLMFRTERTVRVSQVAKYLDVAPSTAHRLLAMLQHHKFVAQNVESKAYGPGEALVDLGVSLLDLSDMRLWARPHLAALAAKLDETVAVGVLRGMTLTFVESVEVQRALRVGTLRGANYPAHITAGGKAILAFLPADTVSAMYQPAGRTDAARLSAADFDTLIGELAAVRKTGYATNYGQSDDGIGALAVPVWSATNEHEPVASVCVSMPLSRYDQADIPSVVEELKSTAQQLGRFSM
ncbi:IclR family transcriptional regulator [Longivirga aurantiaca]|uniref:IclR family transcriptional regulator n=1 Tax=Longivirga aurantiaca TaxID=1837743 RepID=A0ABW1SV90_9ACTN